MTITSRQSLALAAIALLIGLFAVAQVAKATVTALTIDSPTEAAPADVEAGEDVDVTFTWSENHVFGDYRSIITIGPLGDPVAQLTTVYSPGDEIRDMVDDGTTETYTFTHTLTIPGDDEGGCYDLTVHVEENWPPGSDSWGFSQTRTETDAVCVLPKHPHMLLLRVQIDPEAGDHGALVGFHRCVDLAAGQAVPLNAHHASVHTGQAGAALMGAGHAVVPGAPLTPWANCEELTADLPIFLPPPPEE